jgi:hypothetical protein
MILLLLSRRVIAEMPVAELSNTCCFIEILKIHFMKIDNYQICTVYQHPYTPPEYKKQGFKVSRTYYHFLIYVA